MVVGKCKGFPDGPSPLSRKLNMERDTLQDLGVRFDTHKEKTANYIILEKIAQSKLSKAQRERKEKWAAQFADDDASPEE